MADHIADKLIELVRNIAENKMDGITTPNAPTAPKARNVEDTMKQLYPSTNGRRTATFNPNYTYTPAAKKRRSKKLNTTERTTGVTGKAVLKDVVLLPSVRVKNVPRGQFREYLYSEGYAASGVTISEEIDEDGVRKQFNELFKDKLATSFTFVRAIGSRIIEVNNGPFTGKFLKHISKQGPIYIRSEATSDSKEIARWVDTENEDEDEESDESDTKSSYTTTSNTGSVSQDKSINKAYLNYIEIIDSQDENENISNDSEDEDFKTAILASLEDAQPSSPLQNGSKDLQIVSEHEGANSASTHMFLRQLQDNGTLDGIVFEAKKESEKIDKSFGRGGKTGFPQFLKDHVTNSGKTHIEACKTLGSAKDEDISTIQEFLLTSYPDTFAWGRERIGLQGNIMTLTTSTIINKMYTKNDLKMKSLSDILSSLQVKTEDDLQMIRVRRRHVWEDSLRAFKKKSFDGKRAFKVQFIGEEAEDAGGPKREYLRLLMRAVEQQSGVLEGSENKKVFTSNPFLLHNNVYFLAGMMVSVSLTQGGPGLCCLSPTLYKYISNQPVPEPSLNDVPDYTARSYIEKIYNADRNEFTETIKSLANFLIDCGMSKLEWSFEEKVVLVKLLCSHFLLHRSKAGIDQFTDGLKAGGLLEHIYNYPISMKEVFVYSNTELNADQFRSLLKYNYSPPGSNSREKEEMSVLLWEEYLDEIDDDTIPEPNLATLRELLIFTTGADHIPPCGFDKKIDISFYEAYEACGQSKQCRLPHASTCSMTLYLPLGVKELSKMKELMATALGGYGGFGSV